MRRWLRRVPRLPRRKDPQSDVWPAPAKDAVLAAREAAQGRRWDEAAARWEEARRRLDGVVDPEVMAGLARARRAAGDPATAATVLAEARAVHPDHRALLTEDARASMAMHQRAGEDEEHTWKMRLLDLERRLARHVEDDASSREALVVLAQLSMRLRRWETALRLWESVESRVPHRRVEACLRMAEVRRRLGDLRGARETLLRIAAEAYDDDRFLRELRRLHSSLGVWTAGELSGQARLRYRAGDREVALQQLLGALESQGYAAESLDAVRPVVAAVDRLLAEAYAAAPPAAEVDGPPDSRECQTTTATAPVMHVSGFLYSGSGAVLDFLRSHPETHCPFGGAEVGFLKKRGNLLTLLEESARARSEFPDAVGNVVAASVLGLGQGGKSLVDLVQPGSPQARLLEAVQVLIGQLHRLWREAESQAGAVESDATRSHVRTFLDQLIGCVVPEDPGIVLLNNALVAHRLRQVDVISGARAIAVFRDPRDQFVSQLLEAAHPLGRDEFIGEMSQRLEEFMEVLSSPVGSRVLPVSFEQFVTLPSTRDAVLSWVGLAPVRSGHAERRFDPEVSRRNIGIHDTAGVAGTAEVQASLGASYRRLCDLAAERAAA